MNNADYYRFADFTWDEYRNLFTLARRNYSFCTFTDFNKDATFVLWRHDVDFSPHSARKLAYIEREQNVVATYFFLLHSEFYNLLEKEITECVREIIALGQKIGLHFDCIYYDIHSEVELEKHLEREKKIVEDIFGQEIHVFSFHKPTQNSMNMRKWSYAGMINTYAEYFQTHVGYCSDSNGYWRYQRLKDVLVEARHERLQVLTHPVWWQDTVMSPRQRVLHCIEGRAKKAMAWYEEVAREFEREIPDWDTE